MSEFLHTHSFDFPVDAARLFQALTRSEDLTVWFAEHVELDARPGGRFAFWGRHTYGAPSHPGIVTQFSRFDPDRKIEFDWPLEGIAGRVTLSISPADTGSKLTVEHRLEQIPQIGRAKEMVDDLWRIHFGALCCLLYNQPAELPDYADPHPVVRSSIYIEAPRKMVWAGITEPEYLDQWFTKSAKVDLEGRTFDFGWSYEVDGKTVTVPPLPLLEVVEAEKLVMQWEDWRGDPSVPAQSVTWLLEDEGTGTRLTLLHEGFVRAVDVSDYPFGWIDFLNKLRDVVAPQTAPA